MTFRTERPGDEAMRDALYAGVIFKLAPTAASQALASAVLARLRTELGDGDERRAAMRLSPDALFAAIGRVRRELFTGERWREAVREVIGGFGFKPSEWAFDPVRLRTVLHEGHRLPAAAPVYVGHRDTWYAHPRNALTCWIPLDDLEAHETFEFYPDAFDRPVPNDSHRFDYDAWVQDGQDLRIGWQGRAAGAEAHYPSSLADPAGLRAEGFACRRAETLVFAAAHLHRTLPQATGRARFSLDFRLAHLGDGRAGRGASDVDNRSRGSVLPDYVHPRL